jgi:hypothetical protein
MELVEDLMNEKVAIGRTSIPSSLVTHFTRLAVGGLLINRSIQLRSSMNMRIQALVIELHRLSKSFLND